VKLCKPPSHHGLGRAETTGSRFARFDNYPENGLPEEEQTARAIGAYAQYACLLSLQMGNIQFCSFVYTPHKQKSITHIAFELVPFGFLLVRVRTWVIMSKPDIEGPRLCLPTKLLKVIFPWG
jgi:hypothetical protein